MFDLNDSETLWLNLTNLGLGLITLAALVAVVYTTVRELLDRSRAKAAINADKHFFVHPGLGLTMADGGTPLDQQDHTPGNGSGTSFPRPSAN
jgi:hypothetical protein